MPITAPDIKFRQSQRLTDNPDGGGRMVQAEVVDGAMNNLFGDIGDEERTTGRSTLRKMFVHVDTDAPDILKDAIAVIVNPPVDSNVNVSMFSTGSYSDTRTQARNRVESYITKGVESRFILLGNHYIGQQAMSLYCMRDAPTPEINDNFCLSTSAPGYVANEQYMRVRSILSRTTQTFYDEVGAFERDVIIVETVTALLYDFHGQEVNRRTSVKPPTRVLETNVIDAASYFSVKALVEDAEQGALSVKVGSPFIPIVPSTTQATPVVDVLAGMGAVSYVQSGNSGLLTWSGSSPFGAGVAVTRFLGSPLVRGSVVATVGALELSDDGDGNLAAAGLSPWSGAVDYAAGSVSVTHESGAGSTSISLVGTPAGPIVDQGYTQRIPITSGNQSYSYVMQLRPLPAPGTVVVEYRALGKWIRLRDNGTGQLVGNPGQGSGTVNYATGSVVLTAGALPDIGSAVVASYGTGVVTERRDGDAAIESPYLHFLLPDEGIVPGSVSIDWTVSGSPVTAEDTNGDGVLWVGAIEVGTVVYATGEVGLRLTTLPDVGTSINSTYEWALVANESFTPVPDSFGQVSLSLGATPVRAGSVELVWQVHLERDFYMQTPAIVILKARDDGDGNLFISAGSGVLEGEACGTINYSTGAVSLKAGQHLVDAWVPVWGMHASRWQMINGSPVPSNLVFTNGSLVNVAYQESTAANTSQTDTISLPPVDLKLTPTTVNPVVAGSVRFTFRGHTYVDRNGSLYRAIDAVSGAGQYAGSIDYASGIATIALWDAGGTNAVVVQSLLTRMFDPGVADMVFRTPGAPLQPGSFTLRATTVDGTLVTATADISGNITGTLIRGKINWETGLADVRFGEMVPAAGNEDEDWYDPSTIVGDDVWRPALMIANTIYLGTVVYRSIPMSPIVVGLDPVRLPSDGRVTAFKPGQTVLIHHTQVHAVASPTANQVVDFGREGISEIAVVDSAGTPIDSAWYVVDLDAGSLTFSDPLNLAAYTLPVVISERIDNRRLCAAVQITGEIELNSGLSRDFPAGSQISTALRLGEANGSLDLQARVENLFDQNTWTNAWSDSLIGSNAPATFNDTDYPLVVDNGNAITERWAIVFTNSTNFEVRGETVGTIATGNVNTDCTPVNPRTDEPYFTIPHDGWGIGWATNNVVRFNTIGGLAPLWCIRTTLPGTPETAVDSFRLQVLGNTAEVMP